MSTSLMYHTQQIRGFQHSSLKFKKRQIEKVPFLSHPKPRITQALERTIVELRSEMSISAISKYFDLDWRAVKNVEKRYVKKKFKRIKLKNVRIIGIDEIFVSRKKENQKNKTVVRDLESGAVLHVGNGIGTEALKQFENKIRCVKRNFEAVAMDMSRAFIKWVSENLPKAEIVFDHFHIIKMMNDKVRRRITTNLDDKHKKLLKNQRFQVSTDMSTKNTNSPGFTRINSPLV